MFCHIYSCIQGALVVGKLRLFWGLSVVGNKITSSQAFNKVQLGSKARDIGIKWTPAANYHITLCFLGDVDETNLDEIIHAGTRAITKHHDFALKLKSVGAFPDRKKARVIWVGAQAKRELISLREELANEMKSFVEIDDREFRPHLTIGRMRSKRSVDDLISPMDNKDFGRVVAKEVILYESKFGGAFPRYIPMKRIRLQDFNENEMQSQA